MLARSLASLPPTAYLAVVVVVVAVAVLLLLLLLNGELANPLQAAS